MKRMAGILLLGFIAGACSSNDAAKSEAAPADTVANSAAASTPNTLIVDARDFAFTAPAEVPAGLTTIKLVNGGPNIHHAQLVRFDSGHTLQEYVAALKPNTPPPAWAHEVGGPNPGAPGDTTNMTTVLEPGSYALICFVDTPDKVPHFIKGMHKPLTVTGTAASPAPAITGDVTMTLFDYNFRLSKPLVAGAQRIVVETAAGGQVHEVFIAQLAPGKTPQDLLKWIDKMDGPPPAKPMGGVAALMPGKPVAFDVNLAAGEYALICFVPDKKDGKPHFTHGMVQTVKIG